MLGRIIRRSLLGNFRISFWTLAALALCAALVTMFTTTTLVVEQKMSGALRQLGGNAVIYPSTPRATLGVPDVGADWGAVVEAAREQEAAIALLRLHVGTVSGRPLAVVAGAPESLEELTSYWRIEGRRPTSPGECIVGLRAAEVYGLGLGDEVTVAWPKRKQKTKYQVVGVVDSGDDDDDRIFTTSLDGRDPSFTYALISIRNGEKGISDFQRKIHGANVEIRPLRQVLHGEQVVLSKTDLLSSVSLLAVLALTAIGVSVSVVVRVVERRKELALMRAVGGKRGTIVRFLLVEQLTLGTVASGVGFVLGTLMAQGVADNIFGVSVSPKGLAFGASLAMTLAVSLCAGAIACARALQLQPAMALRGE